MFIMLTPHGDENDKRAFVFDSKDEDDKKLFYDWVEIFTENGILFDVKAK